jgi:hypothetical protein
MIREMDRDNRETGEQWKNRQRYVNRGEKLLKEKWIKRKSAKVLLLIVTAISSRLLIHLAIWRTCWGVWTFCVHWYNSTEFLISPQNIRVLSHQTKTPRMLPIWQSTKYSDSACKVIANSSATTTHLLFLIIITQMTLYMSSPHRIKNLL